MRHAPSQEEIEDPKYQKLLGSRVLTDAFLEILEWDDYYTLPETLTMDARRIVDLRDQVELEPENSGIERPLLKSSYKSSEHETQKLCSVNRLISLKY